MNEKKINKKTLIIIGIIVVLIAIIIICILTFNKKDGSGSVTPSGKQEVSDAGDTDNTTPDEDLSNDDNNDVDLSNTDATAIVLKSNPSTGYEWTYKIENPDLIFMNSTYIDPESAEDPLTNNVGTPGEQVFSMIGQSEGKTKITFNYIRPWEEDHSKDGVIVYEVNVNKNLAITYKEVSRSNFPF